MGNRLFINNLTHFAVQSQLEYSYEENPDTHSALERTFFGSRFSRHCDYYVITIC
jgi:hypothetical protein